MFIEITRLRTRTVEHLPVAFGRGVVVFNPATSNPTRGRDAIGSRRSLIVENEPCVRFDQRTRTRHDRRLRSRETVRRSFTL